MIFSTLTHENCRQVAELERECLGDDAWSEAMIRSEIGRDNVHHVVIELDGQILGYGSFAQIIDEGHINNIVVSPLVRRVGVASAIIDKFVEIAQENGIKSLTLEVREGNEPARRLYEKCNFQFAGIRKGYYRDKENGCIYWRFL